VAITRVCFDKRDSSLGALENAIDRWFCGSGSSSEEEEAEEDNEEVGEAVLNIV